MTLAVFHKLLAIFLTVGVGYVAGRARWLGDDGPLVARVLGNLAFTVFVPALLFRTTARIDFGALPWRTVIAFFVPVLVVLLGTYVWQRAVGARHGPAAPAVRAISVSFGNSVQLGIPFAAALFGEAGLGIHVAIVSLHALTLLTVLTALVELDLARERRTLGHSSAHLLKTLARTMRNTIIHPVVLPVLAGLAWNLAGTPLPTIADEILATLAQAVVPLCLVLIGMSLAYYGVKGAARGAIVITVLKLLVLPAAVLLSVLFFNAVERPFMGLRTVYVQPRQDTPANKTGTGAATA